MSRELILLSPYRLPTQHTLMLGAGDVAVFLNGYLALWHPAALRGAAAPPKINSPYDHEQPSAGHVYAIPESPPLFLPDDWEQRVAGIGATSFRATQRRDETLTNLLTALNADSGAPERAAPFFGLGFGFVVLDALFEAMDHLNQLAIGDFWHEVAQAVEAADAQASRPHLLAAANRLKEAREILYPNEVYLANLALLEETGPAGAVSEALATGTAMNAIASAAWLQQLVKNHPEEMERLLQAVRGDEIELCGGPFLEREDALLPLESQLWNLRHGMRAYQALLGQDIRVHARKRFGASPHLPQLLHAAGLFKTVLLPFDEGVLPQFRSAVVELSAPDGKRVEAFTRSTLPAESALTYFHLAHHLSKTMQQDMIASLALLHTGKEQGPWHRDWLQLSRLAPVFGQWATLGRFLSEVMAGDYPPTPKADDFHSDYLHELTFNGAENPVSRFAHRTRSRRALDAAWTVGGLYRGLVRQPDEQARDWLDRLSDLEDRLETQGEDLSAELAAATQDLGGPLAERLLSRARAQGPGYLVLNPCNFDRRIALELDGVTTPLAAPARATQLAQLADGKARVVVETPALGFAWIPLAVTPGTRVAMPKSTLADERTLRNEFLNADVDAQTGGLRVLQDLRRGANRMGQQLVYGPGSDMRATSIKVTSAGPALGEIVSTGQLLDGHQSVIARFRQRFRAWWGRPLLELHIEIEPTEPPSGYPWHAYYGARFAWRGEKVPLFRSVNLSRQFTGHNRPETPDYLEVCNGSEHTAIFTGGLPFHQRHGQRMLDVILIAEGETARVFDLALGLDLDEPAHAAMDFITPSVAIPVAKGPPHVGTSGWLFHVDAGNLVLTSLRPAPEGADAVIARLVECRGLATLAQLRCPRNPVRAALVNERDDSLSELPVSGDAVSLNLCGNEMQRVRVEFVDPEERSKTP